MTDLEKLKQTSFHDIGVDALTLDFQHRQLTLLLDIYSEDTRTYDVLKLNFHGINNLDLGSLELANPGFDALEISSHSVAHNGETLSVEFLILTGHSSPSMKLSFTFEEVRMS